MRRIQAEYDRNRNSTIPKDARTRNKEANANTVKVLPHPRNEANGRKGKQN